MRHLHRTLLLGLVTVLVILSSSSAPQAAEPDAQVKASLDELHAWLDSSKNGAAWRSYLRSEQLEAVLAQGDQADQQAVAAILEKYASGASGLEEPHFVAVRSALEAWLADLTYIRPEAIPQAARDAKSQFRAIDEASVGEARRQVTQAATALDRFLAGGGRRTAEGWKEHLQWSQMQAELDESKTPDIRVLNSIIEIYQQDKAGLELPQFLAVQRRLRTLINRVQASSDPALADAYAANLETLAGLLEKDPQVRTTEDALVIGRTLGWLESAEQCPALIAAVRRHCAQPNLYVEVSGALIAKGINREVDDTTNVVDNILGTSIRGTAHTQGNVTVDLVPDPNRAAINIRLIGRIHSDTVGQNGPATLYTTGLTSVDAHKTLLIDAEGVHGQRAVAKCRTNTRIDDISVGRLAENTAWSRASAQKPDAERVAARHAEQRVVRRIDSQASELVTKATDGFQNKFRSPLLRRGAYPELLQFSTTADQLLVKMAHASRFQVAAATPPPAIEQGRDLAVRVHQSLVGNISEAMIGGQTLTDERLAELVERLAHEVPEELQIAPDKEPWTITFSPSQPIATEFGDGRIKVTVTGTHFTRGEQEIREPMEIVVEYTIEKTSTGARLVRQGDVSAEYIRDGRQSVTQVAFKTFVRKKFDALFKDEIVTEGLTLPGRWEKAGKLQLEQLSISDGWVALAWLYPDSVRTATAPKNE